MSRLSRELEKLVAIAQERATKKDPVKAFDEGYFKAPLETGESASDDD